MDLRTIDRWFANRTTSRQREVTLREMFSDSIVQAVMEADGIDPKTLEAELRELRGRRNTGRRR